MKFAIISDIHGNLPALNAVIKDAESENIDTFIFAGDYCLSNPFPDECISRIRGISKKYVILGNEENYLKNLVGKNQSTWTDGQMQISYWCYRNISTENRSYLLSLPKQIEFSCNEVSLHIAHSLTNFIGDSEHQEWRSSKVAERYGDKCISQDVIQKDINSDLKKAKKFQEKLATLEDGIYIFGHSHSQWSFRSEDGKKILINPGSCGLPLDCVEYGVPYSILDISDTENVMVEERRVPFDKEKYLETFINSKQFIEANVWSKVIKKELETCREYLSFFLRYVEDYAMKIGDERRPFTVSTWERGFELWEESLCIQSDN